MAKRPPWFVNAAMRTLHAAVPSLANPDDDYAVALLCETELRLFMALSAPEREHAIGVARCVERAWDRAASASPEEAGEASAKGRETALRAALLHDVGKLGASNNVLWRVLTHLLPQSAAPPEPRLSGLAGTRQARRYHAAYGERLILAAGGDAEVARIVSGHDCVVTANAAANGPETPPGCAATGGSGAAIGEGDGPAGSVHYAVSLIEACDELT